MATLTYSEGVAVSCVYHLSTQTFYSTYDLALHQSACYLLATRVKKEQQTIFTAAIRDLHNNYCADVRMRTQSLCENPISAFCEVCMIW